MTLTQFGSQSALQDCIQRAKAVVVTFSAHWCVPCQASKPALESLASRMQQQITMGIVYEDDLGDAIHNTYHIRAFPTHVLFVSGVETQRVEGANISDVEGMIQTYLSTAPPSLASMTGGETLGGSFATSLSPTAARLARLAKLEGTATASTATTTATSVTPVVSINTPVPASTIAPGVTEATDTIPMEQDTDETVQTIDQDVTMEDEKEVDGNEVEEVDPTAILNPEYVQTLTETMGFTLLRAQKGLLYGTGGTIEGAVEWLMEHQDDDNIDEPIAKETRIAQSYKCNECGRVLSNMANLELHANKTGHSDFEESTECIKPMTEEEKVAKIAEIKVRWTLN
jgi:UBX domain-containing protein 1/4